MFKDQFESFLQRSTAKNVVVDGVDWQYYVTGSGDKTILILTGGGSIAEAAFVYINQFSQTHTVITPTIPEVHTAASALAGIKQILHTENISQVYVVGFSMGGMLAQCLVRAYPELVSKLVLFVSMLPSAAYAKKYAKYKRGIAIVPDFIFKWLSKYSLRKQVLADRQGVDQADLDFWLHFFNWEFDSGKMTKKMLLATSDILIDYFTNYHFTPQDLQNWPGEILLIESDQDQTVGKQERENFKAAYPQAQLFTQQGSGHFGAGLLKPQAALKVIGEFI
jgi:pimeloyl-ACP methyl ester carboxylesterase